MTFNLSEKIVPKGQAFGSKPLFLDVLDVKEFIRLLIEEPLPLKHLGVSLEDERKAWKTMNDFIRKLAGENLI